MDRISKADHVFFLLNGIPQSGEWDVELCLITDQIQALGDGPRAIIKKLCDREDKIQQVLKGDHLRGCSLHEEW
jgi:hypothetical protein